MYTKIQRQGFTLVELLIVIVIIGVLSAALIPRVWSVQSKSRDVARIQGLDQIASALYLYKVDRGSYPVTSGGITTAAFEATGAIPLVGPYLRELPMDPLKTDYQPGYSNSIYGGGVSYVVITGGYFGYLGANIAVTANGNVAQVGLLTARVERQYSANWLTEQNATAYTKGVITSYINFPTSNTNYNKVQIQPTFAKSDGDPVSAAALSDFTQFDSFLCTSIVTQGFGENNVAIFYGTYAAGQYTKGGCRMNSDFSSYSYDPVFLYHRILE